ncbi:MAG: OmcA/MtrC family decaheme c-type cytochrome [Acidobacteriia bacterium]|nr:OmcA/MtrC family decaheme c-type cytochrome [Terriglobia bacterium]
MKWTHLAGRAIALVAVVALSLSGDTQKHQYSPRDLAYYADAATVNFVRPGLVFKVTSAQIASDGTIAATISVTDPQGLALDRLGVTTPGAVSISLIAATIPKSQEQYTAYTTRSQKSPITGNTAIQAGADSGGTFTPNSDGTYTYTFKTKAPSGWDATATHTIGVYGSRDLTQFGMNINYASTTFNFVPNGAAVTVTRDVVRSMACNNCHDQISFHGGSRRGVELCILCHQPQTVDPDTGNTLDAKVFIHKIHLGSSLPSVKAGTPYQIIGFNQAVSDWSTVVFPADARRCETCHDQKSGAAQANAYLTKPTRAACGACHDDVDFAKGTGHAGGPQFDDNLCANCHIPQGEYDFDASIKGAHVIPAESSLLTGIAVNITNIQNGSAGKNPTVTFTLLDGSGAALPLSKLTGGTLSLSMTGPTTDYGLTSFGSDVTTPGYVTESALTVASCGPDGTCTYTFKHAIPANAVGTYTMGMEARRQEVVLGGTTSQQTISYSSKNPVMYFSVDGSPVAPRRTVVATASCNKCHVSFTTIHGSLRNQTEYCVICHNPSGTDSPVRGQAQVAADKALPPQGINFNLLVHRIHTGDNLPPDRPYVVVGFGGSHNDFSDVRYPAMSPQGEPGDRRNCAMCHVNGSEQNLPEGKNAVMDPQGPINPTIQPISSACTGCHVTLSTASHTLANTTTLGESCTVCHGSGAAFAVGQVHAQY